MKRAVVSSSSVVSIGYDPDTLVLEVAFHNGGVYQYFEVPQSVYEELMAVDSTGTFLNTAIKPSYRCVRVATQRPARAEPSAD
jgi:hypothetical protein